MSRDHVASVRLTVEERSRLDALGGPTTILREIARHLLTNGATSPVTSPSYPTTTAAAPCAVTWTDGTFGARWPAAVTS